MGNILYGCLKTAMDVDINDIYSIHTKTHLYQIHQYENVFPSRESFINFLDTVPSLMVKP